MSESGLLLLCKILDPRSVVFCSILTLEIIPEGLGWRRLLQFNSLSWSELCCLFEPYLLLGKLANSFVIFGNKSNPLLGKMDDSFVTFGDK